MPAVSAGGLDYVYQAPTKATIPSSGKQVKIPLASQTFKASAFHEATPALAAKLLLVLLMLRVPLSARYA